MLVSPIFFHSNILFFELRNNSTLKKTKLFESKLFEIKKKLLTNFKKGSWSYQDPMLRSHSQGLRALPTITHYATPMAVINYDFIALLIFFYTFKMDLAHF